MKTIIKQFRHWFWRLRQLRQPVWFWLKRKTKKIISSKNKYHSHYCFAIMCVKKIAYTKLAIKNINSLHYINSKHKFIIYADKVCYEELENNKKLLDYPKQVEIKNVYDNGDKPWQYYKIETFIDAATNDYILTDADEIWHENPIIDKDKIYFLVSPKAIKERPDEKSLIENIFHEPNWLEFRYYSTGFVSLPKKFMSPKIADDCRKYNNLLLENKFEFIKDEQTRGEMRRLSEQMAINLAVQTNCPLDKITTLKAEDGPKNTNTLQSLYYGCANQIND